jgi:hypothetical protein
MAEQAETVETTRAAATGRMARHAGADAQTRASGNWARAEYVRARGHHEYIARAQKCERFYLGGGLQWDIFTVMELAESNRKPVEDNQIKPMVNTAIGYQIANRMDISVRPRGYGADDDAAKVMGKFLKYIADDTKLHWRETEVFADGMIMERGYFDIRMSFERNAYGEVDLSVPDPIDVMPDPDARDYDPENWADVTIDRWMTLDQIEQAFGKAAREAVKYFGTADQGLDDDGIQRPRFGTGSAHDGSYMSELLGDSTVLYHIVDRQYRSYELTLCAVYPTGDIRPIPNTTPEQRNAYVAQGAVLTKRMAKRVKWCVSTRNILLFDDYSPYPWFTIVPFFPYFRRGQTRGMINDAISPQESLNKGLSQLGHILNTVANSGWIIEQNSLVDMDIDQFKSEAAKNGLVLHVKADTKHRPEKIKSSELPQGVLEYISQSRASIATATGMDQALMASGPMNEMSGVAYQARQYAAQQKLAVPLDNLGRTRHMLAQRFVDCTQLFMDAPRVIRVTEQDQYGTELTTELAVNEPVYDADGAVAEYINDLTLGEYDLVISEQPMQVTFDNSQFEQIKSLKKDFEYPVPPAFALRYSSLADRSELAKAIDAASQVQPDPEVEARVRLLSEQANKTAAETQNKRIEAVYGATQAGAQIAAIPQIASLADEILQSAGFEDQNPAPIIPQGQVGAGLTEAAPAQPLLPPEGAPATGESTNPLTPENPAVGVNAGIEAPGVQ